MVAATGIIELERMGGNAVDKCRIAGRCKGLRAPEARLAVLAGNLACQAELRRARTGKGGTKRIRYVDFRLGDDIRWNVFVTKVCNKSRKTVDRGSVRVSDGHRNNLFKFYIVFRLVPQTWARR